MAQLTKLITFAYMKQECDLPVHLSDTELDYKIYRAQEMLRMIMCEAFYQDYLTQYAANTMSTAYTALYPYIKQFVAWQAHEFWIIKANFKITRGGIRVYNEENSVVASDAQMGPIIKDAKYQAEYYKKLMVSYIKTNSTNYPLYCNCDCDKTGNTFHISVVRNKTVQPQPYGTGSYKTTCHTCCND